MHVIMRSERAVNAHRTRRKRHAKVEKLKDGMREKKNNACFVAEGSVLSLIVIFWYNSKCFVRSAMRVG